MSIQIVESAQALLNAIQSGASEIEVRGTLTGMPMVTLPPGVKLRGGTLKFGAKGLQLTTGNTVDGVTVVTAPDEVAILNDTSVSDLGTLTLRNVRATGQVLLLAEGAVRSGHVQVEGLMIERADVRGRVERPRGFGVEALQGAFTLWNRQADAAVVITAELLDISAGSAEGPIRGSGVFVGGHGDRAGMADGGTLRVSTLRTGAIYTHGQIPAGTPDLISGGVFVISGAVVQDVVNVGPVTTSGQNDMVLDNWGEVRTWTAKGPIRSNGPSGIGFVNFGKIDRLDVQAPIQTFGTGARGFNVYDGSLRHASFTSIATHGNGSVGVQVSRSLPILEVSGDVLTKGGEGQSLVKGVQISLKAIGVSVKPGGHVGTLKIGGRIRTTGDDVMSLEIEGGIERIDVAGGIVAEGKNSDGVHVRGSVPGLSDINVRATTGQAVVRLA